jgi:predicted RNA-binding protein YlxR (DUF448 family)
VRTCVGCQKQDEADAMIRLVLDEQGGLAVDLAGRAFGRGAWAHPRSQCLARSVRGGVQRALRANVRADASAVVASVRAAADRRVEALLASARGAGRLAAGSDAGREAWERAAVELVVVARDARAAANETWVTAAAGSGKAVFWSDKQHLGRAVARPDTAVVAVMERGLARAISNAVALGSLSDPASEPEASAEEPALSEVM